MRWPMVMVIGCARSGGCDPSRDVIGPMTSFRYITGMEAAITTNSGVG